VLLKGSSEGDTLGFLGYCPQENALWPDLRVKEHLEVFAAVKGLKKDDTKVTIAWLHREPCLFCSQPRGQGRYWE
jgi:ABC-type multidrug transport system ATPase subunit